MSHFVMLVVGGNEEEIEKALAPYDENLECPHIKTKEEHIAKMRENVEYYKDMYKKYEANPAEYEKNSNTRHLEWLKTEVPLMFNYTNEDLYKKAMEDYEGQEDRINADGSTNETYNPKSKWDWYAIGNRWDGNCN